MAISITRLTGMQSGLDTDTIVENLTYTDRLRISQAKQQKQTLEWKQQFYKEITDKLYSFQNKYYPSSGSIFESVSKLSPLNFSSEYVSVNCGNNATIGNVFISDIVSMASNAKLQGTSTVTDPLSFTVDSAALSGLSGRGMKVSLDGVQKTITFGALTENTTEAAKNALQALCDQSFGSGKINVTASGDTITMSAMTGSKIVLNNYYDTPPETPEVSEASEILKFSSGASNRLNLNAKISESGFASDVGSAFEFEINGVPFSFSSDDSISSIINKVNNSTAGVIMSYSSLSDKFSFITKDTGTGAAISYTDKNGGTFLSSIIGTGTVTPGTDAVVKMSTNGSTNEADLVTITRSSNSFEVDGTTYTLLKQAAGTATENVSINIGVDTDKLVETIKSYVADYNSLLSSITTKLSEKSYRDYPPLTDEQKKDMTDDEIKAWNEKAQSGLLRNDTYLQSIATSLRYSLYAPIKEVGSTDTLDTSLTKIGITTGLYTEQGKLTIDEKVLRSAISLDAGGIINLFTQNASVMYSQYATDEQKQTRYDESGLLWRISDIIKNNLSVTGTKGALIELIGSPSSGYTGETIFSRRLSDLDSSISELEATLKDHENRYYKKFSEMEAALTKMNSMSSWLSNMMSV